MRNEKVGYFDGVRVVSRGQPGRNDSGMFKKWSGSSSGRWWRVVMRKQSEQAEL